MAYEPNRTLPIFVNKLLMEHSWSKLNCACPPINLLKALTFNKIVFKDREI